jgi:hypothetical protein
MLVYISIGPIPMARSETLFVSLVMAMHTLAVVHVTYGQQGKSPMKISSDPLQYLEVCLVTAK